MKMPRITLALFALGFANSTSAANNAAVADDDRDTVTLNDGKQLRGRVVLQLADRIVLLVGTRERELDRADIQSIDAVSQRLRTVLDDYRENASPTAADLVALAERCESDRLPHERTLFAWRAILVDADCAEAHQILGHERRDGVWHRKVDGRWRTLDQAYEHHADWADAWLLRSEHFEVRCDSGIERCVNTLLELEYAYRFFLDEFQTELAVHELIEPMRVSVFRDRKQFPSIGSSVSAYFSTEENVLYTYVAGRGRPTALFHEATHAILHNSAARARRGRGDLPAWLDEGWADFMEASVVPEGDGRARFDPTRRLTDRLAALADDDPYGLHRLLNFKTSDYTASSKQALKYAQGYALFTLLWESAEHRTNFVTYLREAFDGKGQASSFRRIFARDFERLEQEHLQLR